MRKSAPLSSVTHNIHIGTLIHCISESKRLRQKQDDLKGAFMIDYTLYHASESFQ